jgi:3-oxoacyl-[acyl-carrier protein] reductase
MLTILVVGCTVMKAHYNKIAVVTGASRGIGKGIALRLARDGATVVLSARDEAMLAGVAGQIESEGGIAAVLPLDLRGADAAGRLTEFAVARYGGLDILINNAGATRRKPFLELTDEDWADSFALKFFGSVRLTRSAWPHLQKAGGSVVFISGIGGRTPGAEFAAGGTVNAALLSLTKALAELGLKDGVQVNAVNPGTIRTDRLRARLDALSQSENISADAAEQRLVRDARVTRIGEPEDIASLVSFLVSAEGRFLHGSLIDIDGGATKTI